MDVSLSARRLGGRLFCVSGAKVFLQSRDTFEEIGDFPPQDIDALFELLRQTRRAFHKTAGFNIGVYPGLAVNFGATTDPEVTGQTGLPADDDEVLDNGAARDPDLSANEAVPADDHVVRDLN
ncbi:MAG: hypothetical protein CFE26_27960, partial [Verrucomicrobiales bacterium VVV1]